MSSNNGQAGKWYSSYSSESYEKTNDQAPVYKGSKGEAEGYFDQEGKAHTVKETITPLGTSAIEGVLKKKQEQIADKGSDL